VTRLSDEQLRRQGRADAVVLLVLRRVVPTLTAEEWGAHLDLTQADVRAAVERMRDTPQARAAAKAKAARDREAAKQAARQAKQAARDAVAAAKARARDERAAAKDAARAERAAANPRVGKPLDMPLVACPIGCGWKGKRPDRHMTTHEAPVPCPNRCGREFPPVGMPRHLTKCTGPAA
jgi:hypothetical protein